MNSGNNLRKNIGVTINVAPLIDILLVLLIIFMVISPLRPSRYEAKIPEKAPEPVDRVDDLALVVTIERDGRYALNTQPAVDLEDLQSQLHRAIDGRPEGLKAAFLKAPRALPYGDVVKVIDVMKAAGSVPIGLQIEDLDR
jgi:biopolymer transport protein ExbD